MTPAQLRMALGSLEWSGGDLARMAHVEPAHVALFQRDHTARDVPPAAIKTLQEYLERLGFQFGDELAVRFSTGTPGLWNEYDRHLD